MITLLFLTACNQSGQTESTEKQHNTTNLKKTTGKEVDREQQQVVKRLSFKTISEIDKAIWVEKQDSFVYSLSLHFIYKDTLSVEYSPECWLSYPYKIENNKMFVYWDDDIDTKYEFDIVKAIHKISPKYIGKNFMILELVNDTTLKATYPIKEIRMKVNRSSQKRTIFPDKFYVVQDGEMYD